MSKYSVRTLFLLFSIALLFSCKTQNTSLEREAIEVSEGPIVEYGIPVLDFDITEGKIRKGEFFSTLMTRLGVSQKEIYSLTTKCKGVFDLKQIKVGYHYHAYFTKEESPKLAYLRYEKDAASYVVFSLKDSLTVNTYQKITESELKYVEVEINSSLWEDVSAAGATPLLALELSDIYAWTIDFFGLRKGDSFKALYETVSFNGEILYIDKIVWACFTHQNEDYEVYYYELDGVGNKYWNEKGESMKKAFLKAPLKYFSRISSGFTYKRRHPITRIVRPHTGIDYAAPIGTPVMSIGDGVVIQKGYKGGGGNTVKIRHNSTYTSAYLHLSKYGKGVAVGKRVTQGQIIGYVGSTGSSTGPHLDFRIWKNGTPINPLKMQSPPTHPISKKDMEDYTIAMKNAQEEVCNILVSKELNRMVEFLKKGVD